MSEVTFNIADYRPLFRVRAHDPGPVSHARRGFVVLSSHSQPREYDMRPPVIEIRSVDGHRSSGRRGKILRFSNPEAHRLYTMPPPENGAPDDEDPGPRVA
jgi:hypothetical protein